MARLTAKTMHYTLTRTAFAVAFGFCNVLEASSATTILEPVNACVFSPADRFSMDARGRYAQCLGWQPDATYPLCRGYYQPLEVTPIPKGEVRIEADEASLYTQGRSKLTGNVVVQDEARVVSAQTAYIYRDPKSNQVTRVELFGNVRYLEPGRLMIARKAIINPQDQSGRVDDVLYRLSVHRAGATLPAWGRADYIERYPNQDYLLQQATYSTCPPEDRAWKISARTITLDHSEARGVAKDAYLRIHDWPVLYSPYLSFPTSKERKSGFLQPAVGYTNVGGFDLGLPYYWNIAPNYDATITPHLYTRRGIMMGGNLRALTSNSYVTMGGNFLPHDQAFNRFINENKSQYPSLIGQSNNRWAVLMDNQTRLTPNLNFGVNFEQVSDDYYLQDFSTNLAVTTQSQLLRQANLTYNSDHWLVNGLVQSYQTLHPINQSEISDIYQRLPQFSANGIYNELPLNGTFNVLAEFDNYRWPGADFSHPQGPRLHLNPIFSVAHYKPWGYVTPSVQFVENNYNVSYRNQPPGQSFNRFVPRYNIDTGLFFERATSFMGKRFTQTLEPRVYYLYVPYHDQTPIPVYDSAYMIFNQDQLFRTNRFSGFDRIGDANQLAYALTTRLLSDETGGEKASFAIGQLSYFSNRRVQLCYEREGDCIDSPLFLGWLSPTSKTSPIATRAKYHLNPAWIVTGDYVWDPATRATNNGYLNLHYQPDFNKIFSLGYSYLVNGDITEVANTGIQNNVLNQGTVAYAWPFSDRWSTLGVYSYNISKKYSMMSFFGLQYENCCWAVRLMGGKTFKNISPTTFAPQYNSNVFAQILLKGLGSAANSDPTSILSSYLPGYADIFKQR
ncbi:LPS-assembly protein LptD [Legionella impletisoli]|nr:LPS assembly protein LptD [Legionella impletisoli]